MPDKDELSKHLNHSSRIPGPDTNSWQQFADARGRQTEEQRRCAQDSVANPSRDPFGEPVDDNWRQRMADHEVIQRHARHMGPGGSTYGAGETIPDTGKKKGY